MVSVEKAPIIDVGIIAKGPGLMTRPISREIRRIRDAVWRDDGHPAIEFAFVLPGRLGRADFDGFQLRQSRSASGHDIVFIEVPSELVQSRDPLPDLFILLHRAVEFVRAHRRHTSSALDDVLDRLKEVAKALGASIPEGDLGLDVSKTPPGGQVVVDEAGLEVSLPIPNEAALSEAFEFERSLDDSLAEASAGHVDGNEAGDGEFVIFAYGPSIERLRSIVDDHVRRYWTGGNAKIAAFEERPVNRPEL